MSEWILERTDFQIQVTCSVGNLPVPQEHKEMFLLLLGKETSQKISIPTNSKGKFLWKEVKKV